MFRLGIAQTDNYYDYKLNLQSIIRAMEIHSKHSVDLVLFPECATTGYNLGLRTIDEIKLNKTVDVVKELSRKLSLAVALPTPWPAGDGKFFNSLLIINDVGEIINRFDKIRFQKGEEKLFVQGEFQSRHFSYKGYQLGVLICIEAECEAWDYLKQDIKHNIILWPGFYGMQNGLTWETTNSEEYVKIKQNLKKWKTALVQANCASSPEHEHWKDKSFGGSDIMNGDGKNLFTGKKNSEDMIVVDFDSSEILDIKSIIF